jgi:hypothetical protein
VHLVDLSSANAAATATATVALFAPQVVGKGRKSQAARQRRLSKGVVEGLGALDLQMLNKHRPDFADLVKFQEVAAHEVHYSLLTASCYCYRGCSSHHCFWAVVEAL